MLLKNPAGALPKRVDWENMHRNQSWFTRLRSSFTAGNKLNMKDQIISFTLIPRTPCSVGGATETDLSGP